MRQWLSCLSGQILILYSSGPGAKSGSQPSPEGPRKRRKTPHPVGIKILCLVVRIYEAAGQADNPQEIMMSNYSAETVARF